jgi:F-type H+-transporting ATPase subunit b
LKRFLIVAMLAASAPTVWGQEHEHATSPANAEHQLASENLARKEQRQITESEEPGDPWLMWRTINFVLLAGALGFLIGKHAPGFFRNRDAEIQKALADATAARAEAEARVAEIEGRMAQLGAEIDKLRAESKEEMAHEAERTRGETARLVEKITQHSEQEIVSAAKHARADIKTYAAKLALELAETRVRAQMTPARQQGLVAGFLTDLETNHIRGTEEKH